MAFYSFKFGVFFIVLFVIYWFVFNKNYKYQNFLLLLFSYIFYGLASWKFLPLLIITTIIYFYLGNSIERAILSQNEKKASILNNIGVTLGIIILFYFKFFGFFVNEISSFLSSLGFNIHINTLKIIMPLGISFYTFRLMSYVIEVKREIIDSEKNFINFATYVAFFPCILSGPIDRAYQFLPQLNQERKFSADNFLQSLWVFVWGMFLKTCIADRLVLYTDPIFNNLDHHNGTSILLASVYYMFQLYADFCGYSLMALSIAKLLGINVINNFERPFFAINIASFWRRWHISLTKWLTDYIFTPIAIYFREYGKWGISFAILMNFLIVGLWHGAQWNYVLFGFYHSVLFFFLIISDQMNKSDKIKLNKFGLPVFDNFLKICLTLLFVFIGDIIFRANNLSDLPVIISKIVSESGDLFIGDYGITLHILVVVNIIILFLKEMNEEFGWNFKINNIYSSSVCLSLFLMYVLLTTIPSGFNFIYFQF